MVVVNISSGLGNQLFQYAAGRALSLHHDVELVGDPISYAPRFKSFMSRSSKREFILNSSTLTSCSIIPIVISQRPGIHIGMR